MIIEEQKEVCEKFGASFTESPLLQMLAISKDFNTNQWPINGLRHPLENATGWFIWSGEEFSEADDFFVPMHVDHLKEQCPIILKYLGLSPGWRFLLGKDNYVDVWQDVTLLDID